MRNVLIILALASISFTTFADVQSGVGVNFLNDVLIPAQYKLPEDCRILITQNSSKKTFKYALSKGRKSVFAIFDESKNFNLSEDKTSAESMFHLSGYDLNSNSLVMVFNEAGEVLSLKVGGYIKSITCSKK